MSWRIPLSTTTTITLSAGENLYVARDVDIFVENGYSIYAFPDSNIIVEGSLITDEYEAIEVGSSSNVTITVTASGRIRSLDSDGIGTGGTGSVINNAGTIIASDDGISVGSGNKGIATINNSGKISGNFGVYVNSIETVILHNSGTIAGTSVSYGAGDGGTNVSLITNTGRMMGKLQLGLGNDLYDGRKGHVNALVAGADGNDRIYGGTEKNIISGDAGKDQLWGGGGADILTGGTGADRFIFKTLDDSTSAASGRDTITDFAHGIDTIDLHAMDANIRAKDDQAFHFIGAQDFHHKAGELHFVRTSGDTVLQGDVNGDGKADFAITLTGHISLNSGDFAL